MKIEMQTVYHYTSLETLFKLLDGIKDENFVFYATRISEMNDTSELFLGFSSLWNYLPIIEKDLHIVEDNYKLSQLVEKDGASRGLAFLKKIVNNILKSRNTPFVISFSNSKDSLPMWNTYASNGNGVSLGFKIQLSFNEVKTTQNSIIDLTKYNPNYPFSLKVSYDNISNNVVIRRCTRLFYSQYYEKVRTCTDMKEIINLQSDFIEKIGIALATLIKHPSYSYERESRYYRKELNENNIKYRINAKGNIIPYIEVGIPISFLKRIVVGPCRDMSSVEDVIRLRLKQIGLNSIEIEKSKIPYRDI